MTRRPPKPLDFTPGPDMALIGVDGPVDVRPVRRTRLDPAPLVRRGDEELGWSRYAYAVALAAALAWGGALVAFVMAYETGSPAFSYDPFRYAVAGGLALLPPLFMLLGAHAVRQSARLAAETRRARALAGDLITPAALAVAGTGDALEGLRGEIARAAAAADEARRQLSGLNDSLAGETERLTGAAAEANRAAEGLAASVAHHRDELGALAGALEGHAHSAADAAARHAGVLAEAAGAAQARLETAEAALDGRAQALTGSAETAGRAAEDAGRVLGQQTDRLERAGAFLGERYRGLEASLGDRHAALEHLAEVLRDDQARAADLLDAQRAALEAATHRSQDGAQALAEAADAGARTLADLIAEAAGRIESFSAAARAEQDTLEADAQAGLGLFTGAVAEERGALQRDTQQAIDALAASAASERTGLQDEVRRAMADLAAAVAETRAAAAQGADDAQRRAADSARAAREQVDQLNEAAFALGQRADQAFEQRIAAARKLIEQSAVVVEEAGARSVSRIERGLATAHAALDGVNALLEAADRRMAELPAQARVQVEQVRQAVTAGVGELTAAARQAAEETQAIDAAFQARIRRNTEVLSEAVRLMGKVAGGFDPAPSAPAAPLPAAAPPPAAVTIPVAATPAVATPTPQPQRTPSLQPAASEPARTAAVGERPVRPAAAPLPAAEPALRPAALSTPEPSAAALGLRPRLKLTAGPDEPMEALLRPAADAAPPAAPTRAARKEPADWTWKDLLSPSDELPVDDDEALADRMLAEIGGIGVDPGVALSPDRVDAAAAALQYGEAERARAVVRAAAPAAIHRLSRRVLTDKVLRAEAERYVSRYAELVGEAAIKDEDGFMTATLLGSDPGRAFLLLDAAVRELA